MFIQFLKMDQYPFRPSNDECQSASATPTMTYRSESKSDIHGYLDGTKDIEFLLSNQNTIKVR